MCLVRLVVAARVCKCVYVCDVAFGARPEWLVHGRDHREITWRSWSLNSCVGV